MSEEASHLTQPELSQMLQRLVGSRWRAWTSAEDRRQCTSATVLVPQRSIKGRACGHFQS
jgi:hypothetical protein